MQIKKAGIIIKRGSSEPQRIGDELAAWFSSKGVDTSVNEITPDMDILVILGGDGTLLHVADKASRYDIPVVGVNLGNLGFLTEVAASERIEVLESILAESILIEERTMLKARLRSREGQDTAYEFALNEVAINKDNIEQVVKLSTWADQDFITTYKADGLIFSTPTGSTAYNLSAGGPIVHPDLPCILVTPICPFMLESRPVLLPATVTITAKLAGPVSDVKIIVDGRFAWDMEEGDMLEVVVSEKPLRLISSPNKSYFDILRNKLNWGGRGGGSLPLPSTS